MTAALLILALTPLALGYLAAPAPRAVIRTDEVSAYRAKARARRLDAVRSRIDDNLTTVAIVAAFTR